MRRKPFSKNFCALCGHACQVRRDLGQIGRCGALPQAELAAALLHYGEEPPISGLDPALGGSGTIFFSRCNLRCVFCQNWQISQPDAVTPNAPVPGQSTTTEDLAEIMLGLQKKGALNINLVSPTPHAHAIVPALRLARTRGLRLPVVYNSGGYDSILALRLLDGLVDIYLPDAKLGPAALKTQDRDPLALRLLGAEDYVSVNQTALREMFRQVGHLKTDRRGAAMRGLLIRHLVLPADLARTRSLIPLLAANFGPDLHLSLMAQYQPLHLTQSRPENFGDLPGLLRPLRADEYEEGVDLALQHGLTRAFVQELEAGAEYLPDFRRRDVFR
ncbi:MAG: radical SAM protein [Deltaproteobacteria bacterium]|jgi:putative pyruvate formate lyase activating enzyme|nr:radical SAM protein [Deltaproteobacteria bacterium]